MATRPTPSTKTQPKPKPKWSDLPKEVLHNIASHLDWRTDLPRARAVCPSWRSNLPKNPPLLSTTKLKIPPNSPNALTIFPSHFALLTPISNRPESKSKSPWLIRVNRTTAPNTFNLLDHFSYSKFIYTKPPITTSLSLLNTNFLHLFTTYTLFDEQCISHPRCSDKVVGGWALDSPFRFSVLIQSKNGPPAFWKLGDKNVTPVKDRNSDTPLKIVESAYYNKKIYSFDLSRWEIGVIDPSKVKYKWANMEFHPAPDIHLFFDDNIGRCMLSFKDNLFYLRDVSLVPTGVGLYLVFKVTDMADDDKGSMIVYKMRESGVKPTWENVETLDDHVFFTGFGTNFALPNASVNLPKWKPNSICVFTPPGDEDPLKFPVREETFGSRSIDMLGEYLGVFVMGEEEKGIVPFDQLPKKEYTGLFFPPPPWVIWLCPGFGKQIRFSKFLLGKGIKVGGGTGTVVSLRGDGSEV